jgi:phosphohistidine phosphatase
MPRLLILRHAEAERARPGESDFERRLSVHGRTQAAEIGAVLARRREAIEQVLCSPALRTRETWRLVGLPLAAQPSVVIDDALYEAGGDYLDFLRGHATGAAVLLVGHNPAAQATAVRLVGAPASPAVAAFSSSFPPAALAIFDGDRPWDRLAPGTMRLVAFIVAEGS